MKSSTPTLEINLSKICENYKKIEELCSPSIVSAVIKADAYGLGASIIAKNLAKEGCRDFFVATCKEGIAIRKVLPNESFNIYVLHGPFTRDVSSFSKYKLTPVINHLDQLKIWQKYAEKTEKKLHALLHINTGIHRYGMLKNEIDLLIQNPILAKNIDFNYIMSHLSCSDEQENSYNLYQIDNFKKILSNFPNAKGCFANSGGVFLGKEYHFDMVRVGAALYGINENAKNPISLHAPIIQIQKLEKGLSIGYGKSYTTNKASIIATIAMGYADGYLRHFGNNSFVFIDNYKVPIVGRISMDFLTIDVTNVPKDKIFLGAKVEIIGNHIHPNELAFSNKTIAYEMLTLLGKRYKKKYITS